MAARALYESVGYEEIFRERNASAVRLQPGSMGVASALLLTANSGELLQSVPQTEATRGLETASFCWKSASLGRFSLERLPLEQEIIIGPPR